MKVQHRRNILLLVIAVIASLCFVFGSSTFAPRNITGKEAVEPLAPSIPPIEEAKAPQLQNQQQ